MNLDEKIRDKIYDKLTINFPEGLNLKQSENLLEYIVRKLKADLKYGGIYHKSIDHTEEGLKIKDGSFSLNVHISLLANAKKSEHFTIENSEDVSENEAGKLEFLTDPESDIDDYEEEFRVCADVREVVERYFESCYESKIF